MFGPQLRPQPTSPVGWGLFKERGVVPWPRSSAHASARQSRSRRVRGDGAIETTDRSEAALYVCVGVTVVRESAGPTKQAERQSRPAPARSSSSTVEWRRQWRCDPSQRRQKGNLAPSPSLSLSPRFLSAQLSRTDARVPCRVDESGRHPQMAVAGSYPGLAASCHHYLAVGSQRSTTSIVL